MRSEVAKKETGGHMLLVALIRRCKKSTRERNRRRTISQKQHEEKEK